MSNYNSFCSAQCDGDNQVQRLLGDGASICYQSSGSQTYSWADAQTYCNETLAGALALISDEETQSFIDTFEFANGIGATQMWIGGYLEQLDDWTWEDGTIIGMNMLKALNTI